MAVTYDNIHALSHLESDRFAGGNPFGANPVQQNVNDLGQIAQLTQMVNSINQAAQQSANAARIPGGRGLENLSSANIGNALAGQVDPSVLAQLGQRAAERGVATGSPTGPGSNAAYLRALGLTTMDLMNTGQNWLTQATNRNPAAPLFDPSSMFITPFQSAQLDLERDRLNRMGRGGGGGGGGGFVSPETMTGNGGIARNWDDVFGENNRTLTFAAPQNDIMAQIAGVQGTQGPPSFYNPNDDTMSQFDTDYFDGF